MTSDKKTVLLVDDEFIVALGVANLIDWAHYGYDRVICCQSGEEAIEKAEEQPLDLVVTDICMRGIQGLDLMRELYIRQLCSRFIVISGYAEFAYAQEAMSFGVRHYLLKPVNKMKLEEAVASFADLCEDSDTETEEETHPLLAFSNDRKRQLYNTYLAYIRVNYQKNITISDLAEELHINPSYAGQQFHSIMDKTFSEFLHEYRIEQAKKLLLKSYYTISEIGIQVGYSNMAHFYRCFRKQIGMTPSEFRLKYKRIQK